MLSRGPAGPSFEVPIDLFPSVAWAEQNIGRWVLLTTAGAARVVPGPDELCARRIDAVTGDLVLVCALCSDTELGRLSREDAKAGNASMVDQIKRMIMVHLKEGHPEILDSIK